MKRGSSTVMAGLAPAIHVLSRPAREGVDPRAEPGEDGGASCDPLAVMAGLEPAIHVFAAQRRKAWIPGPSPGMTVAKVRPATPSPSWPALRRPSTSLQRSAGRRAIPGPSPGETGAEG